MSQVVIKRDWSIEPFQTQQIIDAIENLFVWLQIDDKSEMLFKIIKNFETKLPEKVSTSEIDNLLLKAIEPLISQDPMYDKLATRQLAKQIHKDVLKKFSSFKDYINYSVENELLRKDMLDFDLDALEWHIDHSRDDEFDFFWLTSLHKKYQLHDYAIKWNKIIIELPQWTWMRMAMGLAFLSPDKNEVAKKIYDKFSTFKYMHSHSYNSGYVRAQMSSCFISVVDDSLDSIMEKASELAHLAKYEWGVWIAVSKLRAQGSLIRWINQNSSWPIPFIKIYDTVKHAMLQWTNKRKSALVVYMEPWHYNIGEFLDLKETTWNEYVRTRTINTALWVSDNFMERVKNDQDWYLFDPSETPELADSWWEEFTKHYDKYAALAEEWKLILWKKMRARELYENIMTKLAKTWNNWMTFKDTHNRGNQAPSYWMIHSSNLCTEISIPNTATSTAVCTIASINLTRMYDKNKAKTLTKDSSLQQKLDIFDRDEFKDTIATAIEALDNEVDFNFYPHPHWEKNNKDLRPLWLGIMGLAEMFLDLKIPYESDQALEISDYLWKFMYETALQKSKDIAKIKWPFRDYDEKKYNYEPRRNILLLAIAPTASISLLLWTSSTIDAHFSLIYSRESQHWKFTIVVKQLVEELKEKWLWNENIKNQIINAGWSLQNISALEWIIDKELYKTAYEISPKAQIDVAAAWQKHVDQAISRNMYFEESLREKIWDWYMYAWEKWLKSTYYCFIEKKIQWEKYTQEVSKRWTRTGFWSRWFWAKKIEETSIDRENLLTKMKDWQLTDEDKKAIEENIRKEKWNEYFEKLKAWNLYQWACPSDPFEAVMCESCQ